MPGAYRKTTSSRKSLYEDRNILIGKLVKANKKNEERSEEEGQFFYRVIKQVGK